MIISYKHRYLFIERPLTGSWAIRHELCEYYDGIPILHKHAGYSEFRRHARPEELKCLIFTGIRNPLDLIVSRYFKLMTDHKGAFSNPETTKTLITDYSDLVKYQHIMATNATFEEYFLRYCTRPYGDLFDLKSDYLGFVIRFENFQDDFSEVLHLLGIEQARPVPVTNKTQGRGSDWASYYTPKIIEQAKRICGPFMSKWGYEFPPGWGDYQPSWASQIEYRLFITLRHIYISYFRYNNNTFARMVRSIRSYF